MALGVGGMALALYSLASHELADTAKKRLAQASAMLAAQSENWFGGLAHNAAGWGEVSLVRDVVVSPQDGACVDMANKWFQGLVRESSVLQTVNLLDLNARCIASSIPSRIGLVDMQNVVRDRSDFLEALQGRAGVSGAIWGHATQRPIVAVSVPVWVEGRVAGVLRVVVDLGFYNDKFLGSLLIGLSGRAYVFDPDMESKMSPNPKIWDIVTDNKYASPIRLPDEVSLGGEEGFFIHGRGRDRRLAAFRRAHVPDWVFVVEEPLAEINAPIRLVRNVTLGAATFILLAVWVAIRRATRPIIRGIEQCASLAQEIEHGKLDRRLSLDSPDEVGLLAQGLNHMSESIRTQREQLQAAEAMYRGVFESAAEGIVRTNGDGGILMVNPAMVRMLGYDSPEQLLDRSVQSFYTDAGRRDEFIARLARDGVVHDFEVELVRRDGRRLSSLLDAQAEKNNQGEILLINGIVHDVTARQEAELARRRLVEAEKLVAQARLRMLRLQMNPHFLFNTLNSIDALVAQDPAGAQRMVRLLATFCRASLLVKEDGMSTVGEELHLIDQYLAIEKVRWGDALRVEFAVQAGVETVGLPAFVLQPLVGNAIKYGQLSGADPLHVRVSAARQDGQVVLEVDNRGRWFSAGERPVEASTGVGLSNVEQRLRNLYGDRIRIDKLDEDGWVKVRIVLTEDEGREC